MQTGLALAAWTMAPRLLRSHAAAAGVQYHVPGVVSQLSDGRGEDAPHNPANRRDRAPKA